MPPVLTIFANCTPAIGFGHLMRCITLAKAVAASGRLRPRIAMSRDSDGSLAARHGIELVRTGGSASAGDAVSGEVMEVADSRHGPILLDDYRVDAEDLSKLRDEGYAVAMMEDGRRLETYICHLVIDSAPDAAQLDYRGTPETKFCLGTKYFPLREEFVAGVSSSPLSAEIREVALTFGGSDADDFTAKLLRAILPISGGWSIKVVLGPAYAGTAENVAAGQENVRVHRAVDNMAAVLADTDLVIAGSGGTALEVAFLGRPMAIVAMAPNQLPITNALDRAGAALSLGDWREFDPAAAADRIAALARDGARRIDMARRASALIDGKGAARIADLLDKMWTTHGGPDAAALADMAEPS